MDQITQEVLHFVEFEDFSAVEFAENIRRIASLAAYLTKQTPQEDKISCDWMAMAYFNVICDTCDQVLKLMECPSKQELEELDNEVSMSRIKEEWKQESEKCKPKKIKASKNPH